MSAPRSDRPESVGASRVDPGDTDILLVSCIAIRIHSAAAALMQLPASCICAELGLEVEAGGRRRDPVRPWLILHDDEQRPTIGEAVEPNLVVWTSIWPWRPDARIRFDITGPPRGSATLRWTLVVDEPVRTARQRSGCAGD